MLLLPVNVTLEEPGKPASSPRIVQLPPGHPDVAGRNVVVIADDGPQWFRLRSLTVRGVAEAAGDCTYRVAPKRIVAWDYGALREVPGSPGPAPSGRESSSAPGGKGDAEPFCSPKLHAAVGKSRVAILASRSAKGTPFAVPLWFVSHRGHLYATTSASSWTVRNVIASPRVALLLGGEERGANDRLLVRGLARASLGMPPAAVLARIAWRYYAQPRFAAVELAHIRQWPLRMRYYGQSRPAHIVVTPEAATECPVPQRRGNP